MTFEKIKVNYHAFFYAVNYDRYQFARQGESGNLNLEQKYITKAVNHGLKILELSDLLGLNPKKEFTRRLNNLLEEKKLLEARITIKNNLSSKNNEPESRIFNPDFYGDDENFKRSKK
jgi:hypothetical protein